MASDSATVTIPVGGLDLSEVLAPIYFGFVISLILGGVCIVQAYAYLTRTNDTVPVLLVAWTMLLLDIVSSALVIQSVYHYTIPHFGSLLQFQSITTELNIECLISGIMTLISQLWFARQLFTVLNRGFSSRNKWKTWGIPGIVLASALVAFAFACGAAMFIHRHGVLVVKSRLFSLTFGLAKGFGAWTDILATIFMCMFLDSAKSTIKQTNTLLNRLMIFIIERGALVTLIQTLLLVFFFAVPDRLYWFAFHVNVTKLYANTFFGMLNARTSLQRREAAVTHRSFVSTTTSASGVRYIPNSSRSVKTAAQQVVDDNGSGYIPNDRLIELEGGIVDDKRMGSPIVTKHVVINYQ